MEMVIDITSLSRGGAGLGRDASGRVIFVPFTAPGDKVRVKIISEEKRYANAELLEILELSPERVIPPCPVFGRCGGCDWQHIPYRLQWETKKQGVRQALSRASLLAIDEIPLTEIPAEQIWEYRNRVQLRGYREELGFYARGSKSLVNIEKCYIARPELNAWLEDVRTDGKDQRREYKAELEVFPTGVITVSWNAAHSAQGFRQVHDEQNLKLQNWVHDQLSGSPLLLDLYGGAGNLSLGLAERFGEIHCVDVTAPAEKKDKPANFHFHRSAVLPWLQQMESKLKEAHKICVILDPPREGLSFDLAPITEILRNLPVRRVLLVGCDADSWAKVVAKLVKHGWDLASLGALDFFPQTHHIEALAVLDREPSKGGPTNKVH